MNYVVCMRMTSERANASNVASFLASFSDMYEYDPCSESYLRWQLLVVKDLMTMIFGPRISVEKRIVNFNRQKKRLQRVFDTLSTYDQSFDTLLHCDRAL